MAIAVRLDSMALNSCSNEAENDFTPATLRSSVILAIDMPSVSILAISLWACSTPSVTVVATSKPVPYSIYGGWRCGVDRIRTDQRFHIKRG